MFVVLAALPNQAHLGLISVAGFLAGLGIGIIFPMLLNHLIEQVPQDASKCSALLMLCIILGSQLGGLIIGFLAMHLGIFAGYATITLAMAGFTYGIWQIYRSPVT
jgi:MFS family permease